MSDIPEIVEDLKGIGSEILKIRYDDYINIIKKRRRPLPEVIPVKICGIVHYTYFCYTNAGIL